MKHLIIFLLVLMAINQAGRGIYVCKNSRVTLYSSAPIEDIEASSAEAVSVYNALTGQLEFSVPIRSFHFRKSLMEDHFNEDYMESDKYPKASFKGKITEQPDLTKDGTYPVIATGEFLVHGVTQSRNIKGEIKVSGGVVSMSSEFTVKCADHQVKIPQIVFHNIAESITIRVSAVYSRYQSNGSTQ